MYDPRPDSIDAPPYLVLCLKEDRSAGEGHRHVVAIETQDRNGGRTRWATVEVIAAVREGERFVVDDGEAASLEPAICPACATVTLTLPAGGPEAAPCS